MRAIFIIGGVLITLGLGIFGYATYYWTHMPKPDCTVGGMGCSDKAVKVVP